MSTRGRSVARRRPLWQKARVLPEVERVAHAAAARAGALIRSRYRDRHEVSFKSELDLVTATDRDAERLIVDGIRAAFPDHGIVAEESAPSPGRDAHRWYIDPLDGTTNFAHGYPQFAVSLALADADDLVFGLVHDPMREETFTAVRGQGARLNGAPVRVSETRAGAARNWLPLRPEAARRLLSRLRRRGDLLVAGHPPRGVRRARSLLRRVRAPRRVLGVEAEALGRSRRTADRGGGRRAGERLLRRRAPPRG
jgi:fructose-1,6-bisphosphatase/inositol monophosphatase family enzyme